jgi:hypothetical protein
MSHSTPSAAITSAGLGWRQPLIKASPAAQSAAAAHHRHRGGNADLEGGGFTARGAGAAARLPNQGLLKR